MWVKHSGLGSGTSAYQYMDFYVSADIRILYIKCLVTK